MVHPYPVMVTVPHRHNLGMDTASPVLSEITMICLWVSGKDYQLTVVQAPTLNLDVHVNDISTLKDFKNQSLPAFNEPETISPTSIIVKAIQNNFFR